MRHGPSTGHAYRRDCFAARLRQLPSRTSHSATAPPRHRAARAPQVLYYQYASIWRGDHSLMRRLEAKGVRTPDK
jgi:hypothetical protein